MSDEKQNDEFVRTIALGEKALGFIKYNETSASPNFYELWYHYANGTNPELNKDIKNLLSTQPRLAQDQVEKLYNDHFLNKNTDERMEEIGSQVSSELNSIMETVGQSLENTENYSESLEIFTSELSEIKDEGSLRMIISSMASTTFQMAENTRKLETNLAKSQQQITELNNNIEQVRTESMTDALTGIANRKKFDITMKQETIESKETGEPLTLLLCDIDFFKKFNDTHGHQTGDQVLRLVASILKTNVKGRDLAARYGGEEFAIILPQTNLDDAAIVAEQIRKAVMNKELVKKSTGEQLGRVTLSIGVGCYKPEETIETLIHRTDEYLYAAKEAGRNNVQTELTAVKPENTDVSAA